MFQVKNKITDKVYTVCGIERDGSKAWFLVYLPNSRSFDWVNSDNYILYEK